ncbi:hypothetical protein NCAS_0G00710 [Naumovozyma castellii]|uniref:t-SNARE coiled-coil homology domain-containing protein n=1 Tax=Naumovozyma castellii TaxID=27288 RepID=G0VHS4_NAUCA|nr:hypothetical protein NCAS_0G00710 [Naumovozyma castellii CBS 4309]CCC70958.1 hypothetical protein NCAS_0G00710 [Naumovozyma castellii CBS 4309]
MQNPFLDLENQTIIDSDTDEQVGGDPSDPSDFHLKPFKDSPEFQSLKESIQAQLFEINGQIGTLQQFTSSLQNSLQTGQIRTKVVENVIKRASTNIHNVNSLMKQCNDVVQRIDSLDPNELDKVQIIQREKLVRDVRYSINEFQETQKEYTQLVKSINDKNKSALLQDQSVKNYTDDDSNKAALSQEQDRQEQLQQQQQQHVEIIREPINNEEFAYQQNLIQERDREITNIEQGITELNEIFKDLGAVVQQQGLMVDNIEANLYSVHDNTQMASKELNRARRSQKVSTKWCLYLLVALSVMLFFLILVVFI